MWTGVGSIANKTVPPAQLLQLHAVALPEIGRLSIMMLLPVVSIGSEVTKVLTGVRKHLLEYPIQDLTSFTSIITQSTFICTTVSLWKKVWIHSHATPLSSNHRMCVRDCASPGPNNDCGGVIEDAWVHLYVTPRQCCVAELKWQNPDICATESDPSTPGTLQFYVNQQEKKCVQDCLPIGVGPCGGPPKQLSAQLFGSAPECCAAKLSWLSPAKCLAATNRVPVLPGAVTWYVDWQHYKCVKDCDGIPPCGGLKDTWDIGHTSKVACCDNMLPWEPNCYQK